MKYFVFNEIVAVAAETKEEAFLKLNAKLENGLMPKHFSWWLKPHAEDKTEQGHLVVREVEFESDMFILREEYWRIGNDFKNSCKST